MVFNISQCPYFEKITEKIQMRVMIMIRITFSQKRLRMMSDIQFVQNEKNT
jgi:hypothetical protein